MCSVCWNWSDPSDPYTPQLTILFNRDEQRSRAIATRPAIQPIEGVQALMPIDPVRGGTWISTNEYGLTIALLNNYAVLPTQGASYQSRGHIVLSLSSCRSIQEAVIMLKELLGGALYPAFSLLIWEASQQSVHFSQWDEQQLSMPTLTQPFFTSSSWNTQEVQEFRTRSYSEQVIAKSVPAKEFMAHTPEGKEMYSVFMAREKTQTVSISEITVHGHQTNFSYFDRATGETSQHCIPTQLTSAS